MQTSLDLFFGNRSSNQKLDQKMVPGKGERKKGQAEMDTMDKMDDDDSSFEKGERGERERGDQSDQRENENENVNENEQEIQEKRKEHLVEEGGEDSDEWNAAVVKFLVKRTEPFTLRNLPKRDKTATDSRSNLNVAVTQPPFPSSSSSPSSPSSHSTTSTTFTACEARGFPPGHGNGEEGPKGTKRKKKNSSALKKKPKPRRPHMKEKHSLPIKVKNKKKKKHSEAEADRRKSHGNIFAGIKKIFRVYKQCDPEENKNLEDPASGGGTQGRREEGKKRNGGKGRKKKQPKEKKSKAQTIREVYLEISNGIPAAFALLNTASNRQQKLKGYEYFSKTYPRLHLPSFEALLQVSSTPQKGDAFGFRGVSPSSSPCPSLTRLSVNPSPGPSPGPSPSPSPSPSFSPSFSPSASVGVRETHELGPVNVGEDKLEQDHKDYKDHKHSAAAPSLPSPIAVPLGPPREVMIWGKGTGPRVLEEKQQRGRISGSGSRNQPWDSSSSSSYSYSSPSLVRAPLSPLSVSLSLSSPFSPSSPFLGLPMGEDREEKDNNDNHPNQGEQKDEDDTSDDSESPWCSLRPDISIYYANRRFVELSRLDTAAAGKVNFDFRQLISDQHQGSFEEMLEELRVAKTGSSPPSTCRILAFKQAAKGKGSLTFGVSIYKAVPVPEGVERGMYVVSLSKVPLALSR